MCWYVCITLSLWLEVICVFWMTWKHGIHLGEGKLFWKEIRWGLNGKWPRGISLCFGCVVFISFCFWMKCAVVAHDWFRVFLSFHFLKGNLMMHSVHDIMGFLFGPSVFLQSLFINTFFFLSFLFFSHILFVFQSTRMFMIATFFYARLRFWCILPFSATHPQYFLWELARTRGIRLFN